MAEQYYTPDRLYRLEAGELKAMILTPGEPVELVDVDVDTDSGPARLHAATFVDRREDSWFIAEILPVLVASAERMAPWVRWYAAPTFTDAGGKTVTWGGRAHGRSDVILLQSRYSTHWTMDTIFHEIWHVLQGHLTEAEREAVGDAVEGGPRFLDDRYRGSTSEREARAFAAWCVARLESPGEQVTGWRAWARRAGLAPHERVWEAAWSGALARRAMARGWVPQRLSAAARKARSTARAALGAAGLRRHPAGIAAA